MPQLTYVAAFVNFGRDIVAWGRVVRDPTGSGVIARRSAGGDLHENSRGRSRTVLTPRKRSVFPTGTRP